jgi:hypothetical protein
VLSILWSLDFCVMRSDFHLSREPTVNFRLMGPTLPVYGAKLQPYGATHTKRDGIKPGSLRKTYSTPDSAADRSKNVCGRISRRLGDRMVDDWGRIQQPQNLPELLQRWVNSADQSFSLRLGCRVTIHEGEPIPGTPHSRPRSESGFRGRNLAFQAVTLFFRRSPAFYCDMPRSQYSCAFRGFSDGGALP